MNQKVPIPWTAEKWTSARRKLMNWFKKNQRELPWRKNRDPYWIWISEVMLQQTQVSTVRNYFPRFIEKFPTLQDLALAAESEVLKCWQGLGYYRRARDLHRSAKMIYQDNGNQIPKNIDYWQNLPGIGRYLLGAILSQAFELRLPIVEANTRRLYARIFAIREDLAKGSTQSKVWQLAEQLLPHKKIGDFNQALMELGSLVCTQDNPQCQQCPLNSICLANQQNCVNEIPLRAPKKNIQRVNQLAFIIQKNNQWLICQKPADGRWGNLWEFPSITLADGDSLLSFSDFKLEESLGISGTFLNESFDILYSITRFKVQMRCFQIKYTKGTFLSNDYSQYSWVSRDEVSNYPFSTPHRKIIQKMQNSEVYIEKK